MVGGAGYLFGNALQSIIGNIKRYELSILVAIAGMGILVWVIGLYRRKKKDAFSSRINK